MVCFAGYMYIVSQCNYSSLCKLINYLQWYYLSIFLAHLSWKHKWAFMITCCPSSVCLSVRPSVYRLFTFSSCSQEPLGQFQQNLAQCILGWRGFKFIQMKGPAFFPRIDNLEIANISSPELLGQFRPNLVLIILRWRGFQFVQMKDPHFSRGEIILK